MTLRPCLSVRLRHRQLAEGEHRDPSQVSSLCAVWSRRGEILQLPRPLLQLCRCGRAVRPNRGHHCWRQAWLEKHKHAHVHRNSSNIRFLDNDPKMLWSTDIPSAPSKVIPTNNTDTSVVVSWEASRDAKELVGYYIEASMVGSNVWEPCNNKPVNGTR